MRVNRTMRMALVMFMLFSGFVDFTLASNRLRLFTFHNTRLNWENSVNRCKERNESLVTLYDEGDATFLQTYLVKTNHYRSVWTGLRRSRANVSTWSDGVTYAFSNSSVAVSSGEQMCEAMEKNTWKGFKCSERKAFMCRKDHKYILIANMKKNWCQAQRYCRRHFQDLVSISDKNENQQVISEGGNNMFWIGLMHDGWEWKDQSCSTFRAWKNTGNPPKQKCTALRLASNLMLKMDCNNENLAFCSKGNVRIILIRDPLTWKNALDYCLTHHTGLLRIEDESDQQAVQQQLTHSQVNGPFWIGLRQSRVFGFWIWSDRIVKWSNWRNTKQPGKSLINNCGVINEKDYTWRDENCGLLLPFLCEEEIT